MAVAELIDLDIDIEESGFSVGECDLLVQELNGPACDGADDHIPPIATKPVTKSGDLWLCGASRVLCADAELEASYMLLMDGTLAHAVFTDVPYNRRGRDLSGNGKRGARSFKVASGEMSDKRYEEFIFNSFGCMVRNSTDGSIHFQCIDWRHLYALQTVGRQVTTLSALKSALPAVSATVPIS